MVLIRYNIKKEQKVQLGFDLPDVAWPAARSAALWALFAEGKTPQRFWLQRETRFDGRCNARPRPRYIDIKIF